MCCDARLLRCPSHLSLYKLDSSKFSILQIRILKIEWIVLGVCLASGSVWHRSDCTWRLGAWGSDSFAVRGQFLHRLTLAMFSVEKWEVTLVNWGFSLALNISSSVQKARCWYRIVFICKDSFLFWRSCELCNGSLFPSFPAPQTLHSHLEYLTLGPFSVWTPKFLCVCLQLMC